MTTTFFASKNHDGRYTLSLHQPPGASYGTRIILVSGPKEPDLPRIAMTWEDIIRWQAGLLDEGYHILDE